MIVILSRLLYNAGMLHVISTLAVFLIYLGWCFRKRAEVHMPLMMAAFATDIGLLLYIEWTRHAIATVEHDIRTAAGEWLLYFHIVVSGLMIVLYVFQIVSGFRLLNGHSLSRNIHRNGSYAFLVCRALNYVTSYFVVTSS